MSDPAFHPHDRVEYRWSAAGPFVGEAWITEELPGRRYRLERNGPPFPIEGSIFSDKQLRLKSPEPELT